MGKWTNIKKMAKEIEKLRSSGTSRRKICEELNITIKQLENYISRCNRQKKELEAGKNLKTQGRPRTQAVTREEELEREVKRLRMENELLRDFLCETERS